MKDRVNTKKEARAWKQSEVMRNKKHGKLQWKRYRAQRYKVIIPSTNHKWVYIKLFLSSPFYARIGTLSSFCVVQMLFPSPSVATANVVTVWVQKKASVFFSLFCVKDLIFGQNQFQLVFYSISNKSFQSKLFCAQSIKWKCLMAKKTKTTMMMMMMMTTTATKKPKWLQ